VLAQLTSLDKATDNQAKTRGALQTATDAGSSKLPRKW
jgi:hypothetical protein